MEENTFYLRLKNDPDTGGFEGIVLSEKLELLPRWPPEHKDVDDQDEKIPFPSNNFRELSLDFEELFQKFLFAMPAIMAIAPLTVDIFTQRKIREFLERHGQIIEDGDVETYRLSHIHYSSINRMIDEMGTNREAVRVFPQMLLMGLVSFYDEVFSKLCRLIYLHRPQILSRTETSISFQDLVQIGSIEEARNKAIDKEIESLMRQNRSDQIAWLEKILEVSDLRDNENWRCIAEVFERRILITHNAGIISEQYIKNCKKNRIPLDALKIGDRLTVDGDYYRKSARNFFEYGMKVIQITWRKLLPSEIENAAENLNAVSYNLIERKRYKTAASLLNFSLYEIPQKASDRSRKIMIINLANAKKLNGQSDEAMEILEREDWSSAHLDFQCCVAAVRGESEKVLELLKPALETRVLSMDAVRHWPVFLPFREQENFVQRFEEIFGESLLPTKEIDGSSACTSVTSSSEKGNDLERKSDA